MNTKILMTATAIYFGVAGICLTFLPQEIAGFFENGTDQTLSLVLQILGALYLGFGMMNWMAKNSLIGGIYNRPLVSGNLMHFLISAFALIKGVGKYTENQYVAILVISVIYLIFTLCFGYVLRKSPVT